MLFRSGGGGLSPRRPTRGLCRGSSPRLLVKPAVGQSAFQLAEELSQMNGMNGLHRNDPAQQRATFRADQYIEFVTHQRGFVAPFDQQSTGALERPAEVPDPNRARRVKLFDPALKGRADKRRDLDHRPEEVGVEVFHGDAQSARPPGVIRTHVRDHAPHLFRGEGHNDFSAGADSSDDTQRE